MASQEADLAVCDQYETVWDPVSTAVFTDAQWAWGPPPPVLGQLALLPGQRWSVSSRDALHEDALRSLPEHVVLSASSFTSDDGCVLVYAGLDSTAAL